MDAMTIARAIVEDINSHIDDYFSYTDIGPYTGAYIHDDDALELMIANKIEEMLK